MLSSIFALPRLRVVVIASLLWGLMLSLVFVSSIWSVLARTIGTGLVALFVFGVLERWHRVLPQWVPRWALQVAGVAMAVPLSVSTYYLVTSEASTPFWEGGTRLTGFFVLTVTGVLLAPWFAMAALLRQRDDSVRRQAVTFERERAELERAALDARLHLLQAQARPHFLFNTLANVRELVEAHSPHAPRVLDSLITYLRAAVPQLDSPAITLGQELELARAYLELMQMRMPDRLRFSIAAAEECRLIRCPPMTLMTLVENSVRHGIDPSEQGGCIDIRVEERDGFCCIAVRDTGVGLQQQGCGAGTGLATLQERLRMTFGDLATLQLTEAQPHGLVCELKFPASKAQS